MPADTDVDAAVARLHEATGDPTALSLEAELLEDTENPLQEGDPEDQPSQEPSPSFGPLGTEMDRIIARAESQLGVSESPAGSNRTPYTDWYGTVGPWCAMFVSWCFAHEGNPLAASTSKGFSYTPSGAAWFKSQNRWTATPARGHVVFFDFPGDDVNRISHVGIVTAVNADGSIDTVEGNTDEKGGRTGGKVMRRRRKIGIVGYGVPNYRTTAVDSAEAPVPQVAPPAPQHFPEDAMHRHSLSIELDADGHGYNDVPGLAAGKVSSVVVNGHDPQAAGSYGRGFHAVEILDRDGNTRVVLKATEPGKGKVDVAVWAVD